MSVRQLIFFACLLIACSDKRKPPATYSGTVEVTRPSAVFYSPDSVQLKNIQAITNSGIFESTMHDCFYQKRNARRVLEKYYPQIEIIDVSKARYLLFRYPNGGERIDLDEKNDPCGLFLYDGRQPARLADMTNIDSELRFYFSR